jgi:hypothetical protein
MTAMTWPFGYGPGKHPPWNHRPKACMCVERYTAFKSGEFLPSFPDGRWSFVNGPRRRMNWQAYYRASERADFVDHRDEPYRWTNCPWCHGELPGCSSEKEPPVAGLSDPEGD